MWKAIGVVVALVCIASSARAEGPLDPSPRRDGDPIPRGYRRTPIPPNAPRSLTEPRTSLLVAGAVTFVVPYVASLPLAATRDCADSSPPLCSPSRAGLLVPIAGPFVELGIGKHDAGASAALALDGAVQAGGLFMLFAAFLWPRASVAPAPRASALRVAPVVGAGSLGFRGAF